MSNRREYSARFAERFRALRKARGLSVQDVADASGVPRPTLSSIERGKTARVPLDEAIAVSEAMGVPLSTLIDADGSRFAEVLVGLLK